MIDLREAAGQLLMVNIHGTEVTAEISAFFEELRPTGVYVVGRNCCSAAQVRALNQGLQDLAARIGLPPLIIALDEEGGRVSRMPSDLRDLIAPSPLAQGAAGGAAAADCARVTARRLRRLGFTMNFAPVADVNRNPANPVVGSRSYGSEVQAVGDHVAAAVSAYLGEGISPCAKHFPGHGATAIDSHIDLPGVERSLAELAALELRPFVRAIAAGVPAIMTAHIVYPRIDPTGLPATLSPLFLKELLRKRLGFQGLVFTDALNMQAIAARFSMAEAARLAVTAGACLLGPVGAMAPQKECLEGVVQAAAEGALDLEAEAARVAAHKQRFVRPLLGSIAVDREEAAREEETIRRVAGASVTLLRNQEGVLPIRPEWALRPVLIDFPLPASTLVEEARQFGPILHEALRRRLPGLRGFAPAADPDDEDATTAMALACSSDLLIVVTRDAATLPAQAALVNALLDLHLPTVVIAARDPYDLAAFPSAPVYLVTYGDPPVSMRAVAAVLLGQAQPAGRLPVTLPGLHEVGSGMARF